MRETIRDLRFGLRLLAKEPGFAAVAVLTLALGIGANTAIFSVVDAVLIRPLPYRDADRLVAVWETQPAASVLQGDTSRPTFADWRQQSQSFEELALLREHSLSLTGSGEPEQLETARVSAGFFDVLGARAAVGRTFRHDEDQAGARVVILSHGLWQRRFAGDPRAVGSSVTLSGDSYLIIGVMPRDFVTPLEAGSAELWSSLSGDSEIATERGVRAYRAIGRLKTGVSLGQAQAEMDAVARVVERIDPQENAGRGVRLVALHDQIVGAIRPGLVMLLASAGFVLLITCANVSNLLLSRGAARRKEIAIRAALGASRGRMARQLLTENILLALVGGAAGLLVAQWSMGAVPALIPRGLPRLHEIQMDSRVLVFTLALSLAAGLLAGFTPTVLASRTRLQNTLQEGGRTHAASGSHRMLGYLVVSQIAMTLVLLVGTGLLTRSFMRLLQVEPGFDPAGVLTARVSLPSSRYRDASQRAAFYAELLRRLEALPGVAAVGATTTLPLSGTSLGTTFTVEGRAEPPPGEEPKVRYHSASPMYFRAMRIPLLRGRLFTEQDSRTSAGVAVINETMARRYWPDEDPLGQKLEIGIALADDEPSAYEVVGIVGDVRGRGLDADLEPEMYVPYPQQAWSWMTLAIRTRSEPQGAIGDVRNVVLSIDADMPVYSVATMDRLLDASTARRRFSTLLSGLFAGLATLLAAVGIYGVMAYSVARRTHEIGVRLALGAQRRDMLRLVLWRGMTLASLGVAVGLPSALALVGLMSGVLYGVSPRDPATFAVVTALLVSVAMLACYVPARRAARVDPMTALRCE